MIPKTAVVLLVAVLAWGAPFLSAFGAERLRVGVHNFKPLVFEDSAKRPQGLFVDILQHIATAEKWEIEYVPGSWHESRQRLESGQLDLLIAVAYSPERAKHLDFTAQPVHTDWALIFKRRGSGIESLLDLEGKRVSAIAGSIFTEGFRSLASQFNLSPQIVLREDYQQVLDDVRSGRSDAGITANIIIPTSDVGRDIERTSILFSPVKMMFAVRKGRHADVLAAIDRHVAAMKNDRNSVYYERYKYWIGSRTAEHLPAWLNWTLVAVPPVLAALLLFNVLLRRQVRRKTAALRAAHDELRESGERYRAIVEGTNDLIASLDGGGRFLFVNRRAADVLGLNGSNWSRTSVFDTLHPADRARTKQALESWIADRKTHVSYENRRVAPDGTVFELLWNVRIFYDDNGTVRQLNAIARDVTELKQAQAEKRETEMRLQAILDHSPALISIKDTSGNIVLANRRFEVLDTLPPEELIGKNVFDAFSHPIAKALWENDVAAIRSNRPIESEEAVTHKDGTRHVYLTVKFPLLRSSGGLLGMCAISTDITDRKQREAELRGALGYLQVLLDTSPDSIFVCDMEANVLEVNDRAVEVYGLARSELVKPGALARIFGSGFNLDMARARLARALTSDSVEFEWRMRRPDGSQFPVEVRLHPIEQSIPGYPRAAVVATVRDISSRKQAEEKLQLAATVFDSTAEGILVTDAAATIVSVNRAFTEITGYTWEEVAGRNPRMLQSERQEPNFYQQMWSCLTEEGVWQGEIWNQRKNGEVFPEWLTISAVRDGTGSIRSYVGIFSDISALKRSQAELEHLAHYDPLTKLPNRTLFSSQLHGALERARRHSTLVAVLLLDLDGFKLVNDSLGHPVGDILLQNVAARLTWCVRAEDMVARLGGDEFAIVLENLAQSDDVHGPVSNLLAAFHEPFNLEGTSAVVTPSIGIAMFPDDGSDGIDLVRNADAAMYESKEAGRNTYRFYQPAMTRNAQEKLNLERALRRALDQAELEVWYQPQLDLASGRVVGAEALVRWRDPERGLIPPADFIPVAEKTGLIIPLGEQVLLAACGQIRRWRDAGLPCPKVAVNVASIQIERTDLAATVKAVLDRFDLPADCLELEVTESVLMRNTEHARRTLDAIQALGVTTAIDDFGTGYSSLSYLKELPIDKLKIDRSFVRGLPDDDDDAAIARAVIGLGRHLGYKVVAEGVETQEHLEFLHHQGCDVAQGYWFSRPLPADEFEHWVKRRESDVAAYGAGGEAASLLTD